MNALTWANPLFLWGLAGLAAPIALHLMNREVPKRVVFPSIRFIYRGREVQKGRRSLRDLLTLLARCLLLAALVLLLAGPRLPPQAATAVAGGEEIMLVVDLSLSLQSVPWHDWITEQTDQVLSANPDAVVGLIATGTGLQRVWPLGTPHAELRQAVRELTLSDTAGRHEDAWRELAAAYSDRADVTRTAVIYSDFQRSDWGGFATMAAAVPASIQPVSPPDPATANLAILGATTDILSRGDSRRIRVTAHVHNFGLQPARTRIELVAGDRSTTAELEIGGEHSEKVVLDLESPDGNRAELRLTPDAYPWDDTWHIWIGPRPPITVAVIAQDPAAQGVELFFMRKALSTNLPGVDRIEARFFGRDFLTGQNPHPYNRLILLDSGSDLTEPEVATLRDYLSAGGQVILFGGERASATLASLNRAGLMRTRFNGRSGLSSSSRTVTVTRLRPGTELLTVFEREPSDLFLFPIAKYARLEPGPDAQTLLYLPDDLPFLLRESSEAGAIYLFAVGLDPSWSELPTSLSFIPLLRRLIETPGEDPTGVIRAEVGESIAPRLQRLGLELPPTLPDGPGITVIGNRPVVINTSRAESDPDALNDLDWLAINQPRGDTPTADAPQSVADSANQRSLRPALGVALLLLALLELALANWEW